MTYNQRDKQLWYADHILLIYLLTEQNLARNERLLSHANICVILLLPLTQLRTFRHYGTKKGKK